MATIKLRGRGGTRAIDRARLLVRLAIEPMTATITEEATAPLRLRLLGAPRLELANGAAQPLERRTAALLALLAINGATPRAKAAALVWPEADDQHANNSLRQRIFKLRQLAGRDVIVTDKLIALAADIAHDLHAPLARLSADPASCQGDLLGDYDFADCRELDEWIGVARQRWRGELARALAELASRLEGEGRIALALRLGERLIEIDSTQEHAHRRVMRLHYLRGDRAAAMNAFDRCRIVLKAELGVLPDTETQELQRLIESSEVPVSRATAPRSSSVLRPPRLIGRDAEWQRLEQAWEQGRTTLIVGEAGIGKSRLLADFASAHSGLVVRARPGDANVPYSALARLLRALFERSKPPADDNVLRELARILPELGAPALGPLSPLRLRLAVESCLRECAGPELGLFALDDLQFADLASLELLPALAQSARTPTASPRWLLASRPGEVPEPVRAWSAAQDTDALANLTLGPLDLPAIEQLLDSLALPGFDAAQWAPAIARHTGGNPMFILETLRSVLDGGVSPVVAARARLPLPADVGSLVERRLLQLTPDALNLARAAALAGQDFSPELATKVLERRVIDLAEPWRELEAAQVIRDNAFAHDLILEATARSVPAAVARVLHAQIATHLEAQQAAAARIAQHWFEAAQYARAGEQFRRAAGQALAASRRSDEATLLERAAACFERSGHHAAHFDALCERLAALVQVTPGDELRVAAQALITLARGPHQRACALTTAAEVHHVFGEFDAVINAMPEAIRLAHEAGDVELELIGARRFAVALVNTGRAAEAVETLHPLIDAAARLPSLRARGEFHAELGLVLERADRRSQARHHQQLGVELALQAGDLNTAATGSANLGVNHAFWGDPLRAAECMEQAIRLAADTGADGGMGLNFRATLGVHWRDLGRYREALHLFDTALAAFEANGNTLWVATTEMHRALLWMALGQPVRARRLVPLATNLPVFVHAIRGLVEAQVARALGVLEPARIEQALALMEQADRPDVRLVLQAEQSLHLAADAAVAACRRVMAEAQQRELMGARLTAQVRLVQALLRAGERTCAAGEAAAMEESLASFAPRMLYVPEAWWVAHEAFQSVGEQSAAKRAAGAGADWIAVALPHVPTEFRASFLSRNPVNRALLAADGRRLRA